MGPNRRAQERGRHAPRKRLSALDWSPLCQTTVIKNGSHGPLGLPTPPQRSHTAANRCIQVIRRYRVNPSSVSRDQRIHVPNTTRRFVLSVTEPCPEADHVVCHGGLHTCPTLRVTWSTFDTWLFAAARRHKNALNSALKRSSVSWRKSSQPRLMRLHASTIAIATGRELKTHVGDRDPPPPAPKLGLSELLAAKFRFLVHSHMPRHFCGYKLANDGQDTRAIQGYLGHRSIMSTQRYTALAPDRFKRFWKD